MKVNKQADGTYLATAQGLKDPVKGRSESEAITRAKVALQDAHSSGKLGK